jgi:predicted transcriptional regulator
MADLIDKPDEIIADEYGVTIAVARRILSDREDLARRGQAQILASVIGLLIQSRNINVQVHALAIAFGMDQLNGAHSQSEIARELGVTRALVSHYVLAWRDVLAGGIGAFDNRTFRKRQDTRKTYAKAATDPILEAKRTKRKK